MDISAVVTVEFAIEPEDVGDTKYLLADILRSYADDLDEFDAELTPATLPVLNGTVQTEVTMRPSGGHGWRRTTPK